MQLDHPSKPAGFTLIEILIVTCIGLLLAGLVLSTAQVLQVKSSQVRSTENLRQWSVALALHITDHNGDLPRRGQGRQKLGQIDRPEDWFNALPPYLGQPSYQELVKNGNVPRFGSESPFICPGVKATGPAPRYPLGYGMNMNLSPWILPSPTRLSQISSPSTVVFMAEAPGDYASIYPSAFAYSLIAPHAGSGNVLFLDGHVTSFTADYLGCHHGDPRRTDISWKTGTDSDANSDSY